MVELVDKLLGLGELFERMVDDGHGDGSGFARDGRKRREGEK